MAMKEVQNLVLPLLFIAYNAAVPDTQGIWFNNLPENRRLLVATWQKEGSFRCSQAGNVLIGLAKDRRNMIIEKANQYSTGLWREQFFKKLFVKRDQQLKASTSFFVSSSVEPNIKLPDYEDLISYNEVAQLVYPSSLHHYIWLFLNYQNPSDFVLKSFEGLPYSVKNLNNCSAESLSVLDLQSFIYCAALCTKAKLQNADSSLTYFNQIKPSVLPVSITGSYGKLNQANFLVAAYKMYKKEYTPNMSDVRLILIKGIEVVRCMGNHGLDVKLLVNLASIFANRASKLNKHSEVVANSARAELYWKTALPQLEKIKNEHAIIYPKNRLFEYNDRDLTQDEVGSYIEKAKLYIGVQLMEKGDYEKAMSIFEGLKDPYASFYQSQIYRKMADSKTNEKKENITSEMRSQNIILLSRARDCLYLTLDRLREPSQDRDHPLNALLGTEIENTERLLSRIDPDCTNRNECDIVSEENISEDESTAENYLSAHTHHTSFHNVRDLNLSKSNTFQFQSTPLRVGRSQREAKPSPERLDAQIRQLIAARDVTNHTVLEQSKMTMEFQQSLIEEIRSLKDAIKSFSIGTDQKVRDVTGNFEDVKKMVDNLTHSVDDRVQNITDMVQEIRLELNEIKKDQNKNAPISVEDLYDLDQDYASLDYNLGVSQVNPVASNLFSNVHRMPQASANLPAAAAAAAYGHGLYPALYPGMPYPYGALGLPQPNLSYLQPPSVNDQLPNVPGLTYQQLPHLASIQNHENPKTSVFPVASAPSVVQKTPTSGGFLGQNLTITAVSTASTKAPPVNVVITSSDPLPTFKTTTSQPVLSVTIPPQHIKGNVPKPSTTQPHNYQIPLPTTSTVTPSVLSQPAPLVSPQSILSNVAAPTISAVKSPAQNNVSLGIQIEKALDKTFSSNTSQNLSNTSIEVEEDARPDFQPIIPLPDEVPVTTGEENETVLFCQRAKLFRFVIMNGQGEWKERGIGNIKILHNPETGKVRVLMRREQVHKICANHFLNKEITLTPMATNDRAFIWAAQDFADEKLILEKFCVRFKTVEEANQFSETFELAKTKIKSIEKVPSTTNTLGGFKFIGAPSFKPKEEPKPEHVVSEPQTVAPISFPSFGTFGAKQSSNVKTSLEEVSPVKSITTDEEVEEFEPQVEFKPAVEKLPDLVEVKTGEESAEVLFNERCKLFRFDTTGDKNEWKERGIGNIKILKEDSMFRMVMRRDQVHKVCLNHQILKNATFQKAPSDKKAVNWHAQDYSEGISKPETFTARFKDATVADQFLQTLQNAQMLLESTNKVKQTKQDTPTKAKGWECKNCFVHNDAKTTKCTTCETSKPGSSPKKTEPTFSFSVKQDSSTTEVTIKPGWGNQFKPAAGSWECKMCYVTNTGDKSKCVSCETPKEGKADAPVVGLKGFSLDTGGQKFSFGIPQQPKSKLSGFGDSFKPKPGTWECKTCYIRNEPSSERCLSCNTNKDGSASKEETPKGVNLETPGLKFSFGMPPATTNDSSKVTVAPTVFSFGNANSTFTWQPPETQKQDTIESKPRSPRKISTGHGEDSDASYVEEEESSAYFKPVIPLPDIVEVKTGEENEETLYQHRAKLYRFVAGEWKERGLGDVKIQKDTATGKLRVLMRRDQVFKICLNHWLTKDVEYLSKDEKTWLFHAADFSEGELSRDQFCLRFKNAEVASEFKKAVDNARENEPKETPVKELTQDHVSDCDVQFVSETKVTQEEEKEAIRLGLPPKFMAYKQRPDCTCEQCKKDDEYLKELFAEKPPSSMSNFSSSIGSTLFATPISSWGTPTSGESVFKSPLVNFSFNTPTGQSPASEPPKSESLRELLQKPATSSFNVGKSESSTPNSTFLGLGVNISKSDDSKVALGTSGASPQFEGFLQNSSPFGRNIFLKNNGVSPSNSSGNLFGSNVFSSSNIFAPKTSTVSSPKPSIFTSNGSGSTNLFSTINSATTTVTSSSFQAPTNSLFSSSKTTNSSIFGSSTPMSGSIFGGGTTQSQSSITTPSTLDSTQGSNIFSNPPDQTKSFFGNKTEPKVTDANLTFGSSKLEKSDDLMFTADSNISFASLAKSEANEQAFATKKDDKTPFAFLGAGAPVFGGAPVQKQQTNKTENESDNEEVEDAEHDPHFEPIVPLPDEIVVCTGEEDETILFNERAKLFRYDNSTKEWKERGVGELKVLFHPSNNTYRLLLRREQVHKVVLNQRITPDLDLQPMTMSDKAWIWAGMNYSEDETKLEQLAVRLKNVEMAQTFKKCVDEVLKKVAEIQSNKSQDSVPVTVQELEDVSNEEQYGEDDEEEEEDDDDDRAIFFSKRCTLSEKSAGEGWKQVNIGTLEVYYDSDLYASRISVIADDGELLSNTIIAANTEMELKNKECTWNAVEWADKELNRWRTLKATFSSEAAAQEFYSNYVEGLTFAQKVGLVDQPHYQLDNDSDQHE
ncbi:hypothetical protein ABEB36_012345 [Hypothenemus hampei]|uniref:E3 SUMO-protein ligase RanBP2 n=1 Tax=Hypothenemus hampei TaxID=57062 RepID=A0ABD1EAV2_HYPHA